MPTAELLTTSQVAGLLRKSVSTVLRMVEAGDLPIAHRLPGENGAYLFNRADVLPLVELQMAELREQLADLKQAASSA